MVWSFYFKHHVNRFIGWLIFDPFFNLLNGFSLTCFFGRWPINLVIHFIIWFPVSFYLFKPISINMIQHDFLFKRIILVCVKHVIFRFEDSWLYIKRFGFIRSKIWNLLFQADGRSIAPSSYGGSPCTMCLKVLHINWCWLCLTHKKTGFESGSSRRTKQAIAALANNLTNTLLFLLSFL